MKITNRLNLPEPIVSAVTNDGYNPGECDITVTQLIAPPRMIALRRQHEDELEEDAADRIWLLMGSIAHGILERAEAGTDTIRERRYTIRRNGWTISGAFDHLWVSSKTLSDYKVSSVWSAKERGKDEWTQQLNTYALILREHGFSVEKIQIVLFARDWRMNERRKYDDYPKHQVVILPVPLWESEQTERYIWERVKIHQLAREFLPHCTPEERWQRPTKWAVMKRGRQTALGVFEEQDKAVAAALDKPRERRVEKRPGEPVRCNQYCSVVKWCKEQNDGQWAEGE
jgi:hypothetical protein